MARTTAAATRRADRIRAGLARSQMLPINWQRLEKEVVELAEEEPKTAVEILLKNLNHSDAGKARRVKALLELVTDSKAGMHAVIDSVIHPDQTIRSNATSFLSEKRGFHATTYASFYKNVYELISMARSKEMPVSDIEALVEVTKDTYLEGESLQALLDIADCMDLIKHRHRTSDTLKGYVSEVLRMVPDLSRMGVLDERIEEPLKHAIKASKSHSLDETKDTIRLRTMESSVRGSLKEIGIMVDRTFEERPSMEISHLSPSDANALSKLRDFVESVTSSSYSIKREETLTKMNAYLEGDFVDFRRQARPRLEAKDSSAMLTIYIIGLVMLKLSSYLMSQSAEDIYQKYYRGLEPEPSIHVVPWPELIMKMLA